MIIAEGSPGHMKGSGWELSRRRAPADQAGARAKKEAHFRNKVIQAPRASSRSSWVDSVRIFPRPRESAKRTLSLKSCFAEEQNGSISLIQPSLNYLQELPFLIIIIAPS